jgi:hypothetical protein
MTTGNEIDVITEPAISESVAGDALETLPGHGGRYEIQVNVNQLDEKGCYDESKKPFIIRVQGSEEVLRECDEVIFPFGTHCEFTKEEIELGKLKIRLVATGPIQVR